MRTRPEATEEVRGWFKDHQSTFAEHVVRDPERWNVETLEWAKPGTGVYAIRYVIMGPVLFVWGDLESAVYRWSSPITWEFLAGCDLQYFEGKCEASPKGRDYMDYDSDLALNDLNAVIKDRAAEGYDHPDLRLVDAAREAIRGGADEWRDWLSVNGYNLFGDCWYEWVPDFGKRIAFTCTAHLVGIKMAVAQRAAATKAVAA